MPEDISEFLLYVLPAVRGELGHARTEFAHVTQAVRRSQSIESADVPRQALREYERELRHGARRLFATYEAAGLFETRRELIERWNKLDSKGLDRLAFDDAGELRSRPLELLEDGLASLDMLAGLDEPKEEAYKRGWLESMLSRSAGFDDLAGAPASGEQASATLARHLAAAFEDFTDGGRIRLPGELAGLDVLGGIRSQRALIELVTVGDKAQLDLIAEARRERVSATAPTRTWTRLYTVCCADRSLGVPASDLHPFEWIPVLSLSPRASPRSPLRTSKASKSKDKKKPKKPKKSKTDK